MYLNNTNGMIYLKWTGKRYTPLIRECEIMRFSTKNPEHLFYLNITYISFVRMFICEIFYEDRSNRDETQRFRICKYTFSYN